MLLYHVAEKTDLDRIRTEGFRSLLRGKRRGVYFWKDLDGAGAWIREMDYEDWVVLQVELRPEDEKKLTSFSAVLGEERYNRLEDQESHEAFVYPLKGRERLVPERLTIAEYVVE